MTPAPALAPPVRADPILASSPSLVEALKRQDHRQQRDQRE